MAGGLLPVSGPLVEQAEVVVGIGVPRIDLRNALEGADRQITFTANFLQKPEAVMGVGRIRIDLECTPESCLGVLVLVGTVEGNAEIDVAHHPVGGDNRDALELLRGAAVPVLLHVRHAQVVVAVGLLPLDTPGLTAGGGP